MRENGSNPLVGFTTNVELGERENSATDMPKIELSKLASHIQTAFDEAINHRTHTGIGERLANCQRLKRGKYSETDQAKLAAIGGSNLYINLTETKCESLQGIMKDIFSKAGKDKVWGLSPTTMPKLSESQQAQIVGKAMSEYEQLVQLTGQTPSPEEVFQISKELASAVLLDEQKDSIKIADAMEQKMRDQHEEGNFAEEWGSKFLYNFSVKKKLTYVTYKTILFEKII